MSNEKSEPRSLQQQPRREADAQQQSTGTSDFQAEASDKVEGEGSYTATRDYQKNIEQYLEKADVQADAEAARPRSDAEARDLAEAEREGRSHSRGER